MRLLSFVMRRSRIEGLSVPLTLVGWSINCCQKFSCSISRNFCWTVVAEPMQVDDDQSMLGKLKSPNIIRFLGSLIDRLSSILTNMLLFSSLELGLRYIVITLRCSPSFSWMLQHWNSTKWSERTTSMDLRLEATYVTMPRPMSEFKFL